MVLSRPGGDVVPMSDDIRGRRSLLYIACPLRNGISRGDMLSTIVDFLLNSTEPAWELRQSTEYSARPRAWCPGRWLDLLRKSARSGQSQSSAITLWPHQTQPRTLGCPHPSRTSPWGICRQSSRACILHPNHTSLHLPVTSNSFATHLAPTSRLNATKRARNPPGGRASPSCALESQSQRPDRAVGHLTSFTAACGKLPRSSSLAFQRGGHATTLIIWLLRADLTVQTVRVDMRAVERGSSSLLELR